VDLVVVLLHLSQVRLAGDSRQVPRQDQQQRLARERRQRDDFSIGLHERQVGYRVADAHGREPAAVARGDGGF
jgi:hypothetical protein